MYIKAKLIFESYIPITLKEGMLFYTNFGKEKRIIKLINIPEDSEEFINQNGYPVHPLIVSIDEINILAEPEQIAWFDDENQSDELHDITPNEMNNILAWYDGICDILVNGDGVSDIYLDKVTVRYEEDEVFQNDDWDDDE